MGVKTVSLLEGQIKRKSLGQALLHTYLHSANCATQMRVFSHSYYFQEGIFLYN